MSTARVVEGMTARMAERTSMQTAERTSMHTAERTRRGSPRLKARMAGGFFLLAILMGITDLVAHGRLGSAPYLAATACNVGATLLLYFLLSPVSPWVSAYAAFLGLGTSAVGVFHWHPLGVDVGMVFLASYCLVIGYLVFRSRILPRVLGVLMALAGLGWLTLLFPPFKTLLSPYNMTAGILGQVALAAWLVAAGAKEQP